MALVSKDLSTLQEARRKACGTRTGTRTEVDFSINLGFTPTVIKVVNLSDRTENCQIIDANLDGGSNVKGLRTVAAGTRTYVASGISLDTDKRGFTVDISVALITDNDDVYWEAWA
jgi:hypothetical protein